MTQRIQCWCRYDITATGVRSNFNTNRIGTRTEEGVELRDEESWNLARNQQRNWETMNQIISLRCLPERINLPRRDGDWWVFDFEVPDVTAVSSVDQDLTYLTDDAAGVPMIVGLQESSLDSNIISTQGESATVKFLLMNDK